MDAPPNPFDRPPPAYEDVNIPAEATPLVRAERPQLPAPDRVREDFSIKSFLLHWACIGENGETTHVIAGRLCVAVFVALAILGLLTIGVSVAAFIELNCGLSTQIQVLAMLAQLVGPILLVLWICVACSRRRKMICVACFAWFFSLYFVATMSGLGTTLLEERDIYNRSQPNDLCNIVKYIPAGTLCFIGGMALFFCFVSCVVCCCCRVAGKF